MLMAVAWRQSAEDQRPCLVPMGRASLSEGSRLSMSHCPHLKNAFYFTGCEEGSYE